jgi:hypothetical protein
MANFANVASRAVNPLESIQDSISGQQAGKFVLGGIAAVMLYAACHRINDPASTALYGAAGAALGSAAYVMGRRQREAQKLLDAAPLVAFAHMANGENTSPLTQAEAYRRMLDGVVTAYNTNLEAEAKVQSGEKHRAILAKSLN